MAAPGGVHDQEAEGADGHCPSPALSPQAQPLDAAGDHSSDKALALFRHPVRLLWPKSRCFDYLYSVGEKLLENFPVQATLCLYDDSDSEGDEAEDDDEDGDEGNEGEAGGAVAAVGAGSPRPA
eukprot:XP_025005728.1 protein ripply2-like [Gallus gallus]